MKILPYLLFLFGWLLPFCALAQSDQVFVLQLRAEIDPRATRYIKLGLAEAQAQNADYVVLELDTYGGRVDDADEIVKMLLDFKKPIYAFVNHNAASAGAWISIACDKIYMVQSATMGAATVVNGTGQVAPDKYQSFMRGKMRSTAAANGRNPQIAEAMVDASVVVEGVNQAGKIITFTTEEAIQNGYCEGEVKTIQDILAKNKLQKATVKTFELNWLEATMLFFLNPYLSGILLTLIIGGIWMELKMPGTVIPILTSLVSGALYFAPYYLTGLAENWELGVFIIGVALLTVELFVIPGFGLFGFSGLTLMFGGLILMMVHNKGLDFQWVAQSDMLQALLTSGLGLVLAIGLIFALVPRILNSSRFKQIALQSALTKEEGFTMTNFSPKLIGKIGIAQTVLRPSGKVIIENQIYDAMTTGAFLEKDTPVIVVDLDGNALKVKVNK
jgi:membrane-bound serine protease (ClpP class)